MSSCSYPSSLWTENTVAKTVIPHMRLTTLLKIGVIEPNFTAPCDRFIKVAKVKNVPRPAPNMDRSRNVHEFELGCEVVDCWTELVL